ncbi:SDR family NAD(P)-dependent oxidoreductase [Undibacterium sp. Ji67W]|uniref:SDR family NAD(P)-dependent oxidoreductase n=1 Tax=Undibacterium sp. Ji67W TaxID=3413042 RepID=UPI003BF1A967
MQTVLITGGTRGIGLAVAEQLAAEGWQIAVSFRDNIESAKQCEERWKRRGYAFQLFQSDLADSESTRCLPAKVVEACGRLDALVNNAGMTDDGSFLSMESARFERVLNTNLIGTMRLTSAALPFLLKSENPMIVNVASLAGVVGKEGQVGYAMSKGGLIGFTQLLTRKYGKLGLQVNAVAPGFINTDMVSELSSSMYEHILKGTAANRMGEPGEVAAAVSFLLRPGYVRGTTLKIDGGFKR